MEGPVAAVAPRANQEKKKKKRDKDKEKEKVRMEPWTRSASKKCQEERSFRKTTKEYIESPDMEKEAKCLLSTDAKALITHWEIIAEDETKETKLRL